MTLLFLVAGVVVLGYWEFLLFNGIKDLALSDRRPEDVRVPAVIIAELEFGHKANDRACRQGRIATDLNLQFRRRASREDGSAEP
jgi:hypothetical protein